MSRPSSTAPPGRRRNRAGTARRAARTCGWTATREASSPASWPRRLRVGEPRRVERRGDPAGRRGIVGIEAALGHRPADGAVEEAGVEIGQAVVGGEPRGERALARRRRPVDGDDHGATIMPARSPPATSSKLAPRPVIRSRNSGKLVAIGPRVVDGDRLLRGEAEDQEAHGDAVVEMGLDRAAAGDLRRRRGRGATPALPRPRRRWPLRPAATAAMRSDSLTRSSPMPSISVSPSAKAAATASTGYSSIIDGARAAGTVTPFSRLALTRTSPTSSPPTVAPVVDRDVGAHLDQRLDEAGARRVEEDVLDGDVGALDDQRRDDREGGRARVARHGDRLRLEVGAGPRGG